MTKKVRVENADTGTSFGVVVEIWDRNLNGGPDLLVREVPLGFPTALLDNEYITSTRYFIVKESNNGNS